MENSGQPWWFDFFIDFSMKTLTLRWTFLLALQSNRSAEFSILHSPALIPKFPQSPQALTCFHTLVRIVDVGYSYEPICVAIALKLLPVFTQSSVESLVMQLIIFCRNRPQALTCFHTHLSIARK